MFNLFASLAEFERELTRERTQAGLSAARSRGRVGGRPKGLPAQAEATAMAAETPYREGRLSVSAIEETAHIQKHALPLPPASRHKIGASEKISQQLGITVTPVVDDAERVATVILRLAVENNSKFVRGKKRVRRWIVPNTRSPT